MRVSRSKAADRIERHAREGRLIQSFWHQHGDGGRELACLLGAIHPAMGSVEDCPANVMPEWMAQLLVQLFDGLPEDRIHDAGMRVADALRRSDVGEVVRLRWLRAAADDAHKSAYPHGNNVPCSDSARKAAHATAVHAELAAETVGGELIHVSALARGTAAHAYGYSPFTPEYEAATEACVARLFDALIAAMLAPSVAP